MARPTKGPRVHVDKRTGVCSFRFTHAGRRYDIPARTRDRGEAEARKAQVYADVVSGRWQPAVPGGIQVRPGAPLDEVTKKWLADEGSRLDPRTVDSMLLYAAHWQTYFKTLGNITEGTVDGYVRRRLQQVKRKTIVKELSAIRTLLDWCKTKGILSDAPHIASPSRRVVGTGSSRYSRKGGAIVLTAQVMERLLAALPEWATKRQRGTGERVEVRAWYAALWWSGLRPETIAGLLAGSDYKRGAMELRIRGENDKCRFERVLPLGEVPELRAAIESVMPGVGRIFHVADRRAYLRKAALVAGVEPDVAARLTDYDFRHSRITDLVNSADSIKGVMYWVGHTNIATTMKYLHPGRRDAAAALRNANARRAQAAKTDDTGFEGDKGGNGPEADNDNKRFFTLDGG